MKLVEFMEYMNMNNIPKDYRICFICGCTMDCEHLYTDYIHHKNIWKLLVILNVLTVEHV